MAFYQILDQQVLNATITDTTAHNGSAVLIDHLHKKAIVATNTLNQAVTLKTQISFDDGTTWADAGSSASVAAGASLVCDNIDTTLTGLKALKGQLRVVATAGTAPTSGTLTVHFQGVSG